MRFIFYVGLVMLASCASAPERAVKQAWEANRSQIAKLDAESDKTDPNFRGSEAEYLAYAAEHSPRLRASYERYTAAVRKISTNRQLPEPQLSFSVFIRSIETRVGPQRARVSLSQMIPWPTQWGAMRDVALEMSRAEAQELDSVGLMLSRDVAVAYWKLWQIRRARNIHHDHLVILKSVSETVRARVATGMSSLADLQQVDLSAARLQDLLEGMDNAEFAAAARLRAVLAAPEGIAVPTTDAPQYAALPAASLAQLQDYASEHPTIASTRALQLASDASARVESSRRLPGFTIGGDWIITSKGESMAADAGKDAIAVGVGLRIPLWQTHYADAEAAARARSRAYAADIQAREDVLRGEAIAAWSDVKDATRQIHLLQKTLVPQAESTYASVLGEYATGRNAVADILLVQQSLLQLRIELEGAWARYAASYSELEYIVGRVLPTKSEPSVDPSTQAKAARISESRRNDDR